MDKVSVASDYGLRGDELTLKAFGIASSALAITGMILMIPILIALGGLILLAGLHRNRQNLLQLHHRNLANETVIINGAEMPVSNFNLSEPTVNLLGTEVTQLATLCDMDSGIMTQIKFGTSAITGKTFAYPRGVYYP